jgi:secreted trypsin-like serine protease
LDYDGDYSNVGELVNVVGWGYIYNQTRGKLALTDFPNVVTMPLLDISVCQDYYSSIKTVNYQVIPEVMQCIGKPPDLEIVQGTCNGDSGGPVFATDAESNYVAVGIVSWGLPNGCGVKGDPSINTPITKVHFIN